MRTIDGGRGAWVFICAGLALTLSSMAGAQTGQADDAKATYETQAASIVADVDAATAEARRVAGRAREMEGDFARVLQHRAEESGLHAMDKAHELAQLVIDREAADGDPGEFRARAIEMLERIHVGAQAYVKKLASDPELRVDQDTSGLSPAELAALEARRTDLAARVVAIYGELIANLELSQSLGLDVQDQRSYLDGAISDGAESMSVALELALADADMASAQAAVVPDDADLSARLRLAEARVKRIAGNLGSFAAMLKQLELDANVYQQQLIKVTGSITTDTFSIEVFKGLFSRWLGDLAAWFGDNLPQFLFKLVLFALVLWVALVLSRLTRKLVTRGIETTKLNLSRLLRRMIIATAANLVLLLGLLFGLAQLGLSVGPLLAGLGIAGFIVGFALQDTLGNFASGMMILLYRPYDVGDLIEAGGVFGKVSHMSLVNTTILTLDNQTLVMPNSAIWGGVIKNVTAQRVRRVDMVFGIGYADDIPKTEAVLNEIINSHDMVLDDPEPMVRLHTLGESSVDFIVRPWVKTDDYWDVYWDVTRAVKMRFDEEGISIPFPQRDVHVFSGDNDAPATVVPARIGQGPVAASGKDEPDSDA